MSLGEPSAISRQSLTARAVVGWKTPEGEEVMSLPLYERVALKRDLPEHNLRRGDVAVIVDYVPHPEEGERGCVLEVFNALGESIAVVAVPESQIEALRADEVLAIRPLAETADLFGRISAALRKKGRPIPTNDAKTEAASWQRGALPSRSVAEPFHR